MACYVGHESRGGASSPLVLRRTLDPEGFRIVEEEAHPGTSTVEVWIVAPDLQTLSRTPDPHSGIQGGPLPQIVGQLVGLAWRWTSWTTQVTYRDHFETRTHPTVTPTGLARETVVVSLPSGDVLSTHLAILTLEGCDGFEGRRDGMQIY